MQDAAVAAALRALPEAAPPERDALEVVFLADNKLLDGRHANNAWLQELPDPITRITWDNAALTRAEHRQGARRRQRRHGAAHRRAAGSIDIVAWVQPGQAENSIGFRSAGAARAAGRTRNGRGFDVYPLRTSERPTSPPASS